MEGGTRGARALQKAAVLALVLLALHLGAQTTRSGAYLVGVAALALPCVLLLALGRARLAARAGGLVAFAERPQSSLVALLAAGVALGPLPVVPGWGAAASVIASFGLAWLELRGPAPARGKRWALGVKLHLSLWLLLGAWASWRLLPSLAPKYPLLKPLPLAACVGAFVLLWSSRASERWGYLGLHSASLLAALLVAVELAAWSVPAGFGVTRYPYPYRLHGFAPSRQPEDNTWRATVNSTGLRSPGDIPPKPPGERRVLLLGGSTVLGDGSPDEETPGAYLERFLNQELARSPQPGVERWRVINAGQGWYISTQEVVFLVTQLVLYEPDLVIAIDGYNDAHHAFVWQAKPPVNAISTWRYGSDQVGREVASRPPWASGIGALAQSSWLRERAGVDPRSFFSASGRWDLPEARGSLEGATPEAQRALVHHRLVMNWTLMNHVARGSGARALFALQPAIYLKEPKTAEESAWLELPEVVDYVPRMRDEWARLVEAAPHQAASAGLRVFDAERYTGRDAERVFTDYCHLTRRGNELLARATAEAVAALWREDPPAAHYRGVRYTSPHGDPLWRTGPAREAWAGEVASVSSQD